MVFWEEGPRQFKHRTTQKRTRIETPASKAGTGDSWKNPGGYLPGEGDAGSADQPFPAQGGHMGTVPNPKSAETSVKEDFFKNPDADVVADKLSGLALLVWS